MRNQYLEETMEKRYADELTQLVQLIKRGQLTVFCGAGISINSGIPGVITIIDFILRELNMEDEDIQLFINREYGNLIPFEMFIDHLLEAIGQEKMVDLKEIFQSDHVNPNTNHLFLAKLAREGYLTTIFTTNFDTLIEQALDKENENLPLNKKIDYEVLYQEEGQWALNKIQENSNKLRIIKIHGSISDIESIVATIRKLSHIEKAEMRNSVIEHCFSKGAHKQVLILGYSCSDIFDISPQIHLIRERYKKVVLVDHLNDKEKVIEPLENKKNKNPFKRFKGSIRIYCDTDRFIKSLWKEILKDKYIEKSNIENERWKQYISEKWEVIRVVPIDIKGKLFHAIGEYDKAIKQFERALQIGKLTRHHLHNAFRCNELGLAYYAKGDFNIAMQYYEEALEKYSNVLSDDEHQFVADTLTNLGLTHMETRNYSAAIKCHKKALQIFLKNEESPHLIGACYNNLGQVYYAKGDYYSAKINYEKSLEITLRSLGTAHPSTATNYNNLGEVYRAEHNSPKAIEYYNKALKIDMETLGPDHPKTAIDSDLLTSAIFH